MFLVPVVSRIVVQTAAHTIYQCWLLLERNGTYCMSVATAEEGIAFASENGLHYRALRACGDILFLSVESTPALAEFYTWAECVPGSQPMKECWRPFLWSVPNIGSNDGLRDIEIGPGSVYSVLERFFQQERLA